MHHTGEGSRTFSLNVFEDSRDCHLWISFHISRRHRGRCSSFTLQFVFIEIPKYKQLQWLGITPSEMMGMGMEMGILMVVVVEMVMVVVVGMVMVMVMVVL